MSNNITLEMVQDELTAISELYSAKYHPNLAQDIHGSLAKFETIEDLNDLVHYMLTIREEEEHFNTRADSAIYWREHGYAPSVAREMALHFKAKGERWADDLKSICTLMFGEFSQKEYHGKFDQKEYHGALRVGDTVSYRMTEIDTADWTRSFFLHKLWTVDGYTIMDATETTPAHQVLYLERFRNGGKRERMVTTYILSPDAENDIVPR